MEQSDTNPLAGAIRACDESEVPVILQIINAAAEAYRGVIPPDRWHEPYMSLEELRAEIAAGVDFTGYTRDGDLVGVMGVQLVRNVQLIRHAYVLPAWQGYGIGSRLISRLRSGNERPVLVGTWQAAKWAVAFYQRHGFKLVPDSVIAPLLKSYWNVPERQVETSVVLASPALSARDAAKLIEAC